MSDISREQAVRWVAREISAIQAYDDVVSRLEAERKLMRDNQHGIATEYPMSALAHAKLVEYLEARLSKLRSSLH